jgi:predicted phage terminase large subunit-like protein
MPARKRIPPVTPTTPAIGNGAPFPASFVKNHAVAPGGAIPIDRRAVERSLCLESFYDFFLRFWGVCSTEKLVNNWHIEYVCNELQAVAERVFKREPKLYDLIINISPGSSKSIICSILFPAWCWARDAGFRTICGSYALDLSLFLSNQCRRVVLSDKYRELFPEVDLVSESLGIMQTSANGQRIAAATAGRVMGMHAHIIVVDDPINPKDAVTEAGIKEANSWMDGTLPSRVVNKNVTPIILVMQRLAEDDPTGHWLAKAAAGLGTPVRHICIPAELADYGDMVRPRSLRSRYVNGLFDPVRLPLKALADARTNGEYYFSGQYGQSPVPAKGGMFDVSKLRERPMRPTHPFKRIRAWDKAGCLIKGTLITTAKGEIPIEDVKTGSYVQTPVGYREVLCAGRTKDVSTLTGVLWSDGTWLVGTPDHPIWVNNSFWVELGSVDGFCYASPLWDAQQTTTFQALFSTAYATSEKREVCTTRPGYAVRTANTLPTLCTGRFGGSTTAPYPLARISTTSTRIGKTTHLEILSVLPAAPTCSSTGTNSQRLSTLHSWQEFRNSVSRLSGQSLKSGVLAGTAERLFEQTTLSRSFAAAFAKTWGDPAAPVYDLTVADAHAFYANGILVHNTGGKGAFTVGVLMCKDRDGVFWVEDVIRGQWEATERERVIRSTAGLDGRSTSIVIEQEPGSGGKESAQATVRNLAGFVVSVDRPTGDKVLRADAFAAQVNAGNVGVVTGPWVERFKNELRHFPLGKYKDQVDAADMGFNKLFSRIRVGGF